MSESAGVLLLLLLLSAAGADGTIHDESDISQLCYLRYQITPTTFKYLREDCNDTGSTIRVNTTAETSVISYILKYECPSDFTYLSTFLDGCYLISGPLTWYGGLAYCSLKGGHMLFIETEAELDFIGTQFIRDYGIVWTGLNDISTENSYYWENVKPLSNGSFPVLPNTNWFSSHTNVPHSDCVKLASEGILRAELCQEKYPVICEYDHTTFKETYCPPAWHGNFVSSGCYKLFPFNRTWSDAKSLCNQNGGDVVSVNSWIEWQFVSVLANSHKVWLSSNTNTDYWYQYYDYSYHFSTTRLEEYDCMVTADTLLPQEASCDEEYYIICEKATLVENVTSV
ncbi:C-type mannose receptor 2-like isoform X2 [Apostichopus japonicus]|uniref:C-type mannose receptor 2-like isoform X2 n=1 Tax=Stichopus japonicus TaxID=307972 RepID=UPI003AB6FAFB